MYDIGTGVCIGIGVYDYRDMCVYGIGTGIYWDRCVLMILLIDSSSQMRCVENLHWIA